MAVLLMLAERMLGCSTVRCRRYCPNNRVPLLLFHHFFPLSSPHSLYRQVPIHSTPFPSKLPGFCRHIQHHPNSAILAPIFVRHPPIVFYSTIILWTHLNHCKQRNPMPPAPYSPLVLDFYKYDPHMELPCLPCVITVPIRMRLSFHHRPLSITHRLFKDSL